MSLFKENAWESDETGDKLTKELFSGKKKSKPVKKSVENISHSGKKFKDNGNKKSKKLRCEDKDGGANQPVDRSKVNDKKRKPSEITIDETIIKKWKSASISRGEKTMRKEFSDRTTQHVDEPKSNSIKKQIAGNETLATKVIPKKKRNSESKEKSDKVDKKNKLNGTRCQNGEQSDSTSSNIMTKSQKRRLKLKEKLLNSQRNSEGEVTLSKEEPSNLKVSKKIDRIQRLLAEKQERSSKSKENIGEPKSLRDRMLARLKSSRFRYLNEQMYNSESWSSKQFFKEDPDAFLAYHEGYQLQVDQWPLNPLDTIIASIKKLPKDYVVADFGCGEARLADSVTQKVHSLDLVAINDKVTACDMAHTSLLSGRIDVAVFCLSLMGTNLTDYLIEANRVLRKDGILKIAEVESRFEDVDEFVKVISSYGFVNTWKDLSHDLFYFMDFKKEGDITKKRNKLPPLTLKSCLYKRR